MPELDRRALLRTSAASAALGATGSLLVPSAAAGPSMAGRRPFLPYSRRSYFKSRVSDAPINRRRTRRFRRFMRRHPDQRQYAYPRINGVDGNQWGTAYAMGNSRHPIWRVRNMDSDNPRARLLRTRGFHAPVWLSDALTTTSDSPFCVIDRASGFTVFCTEASVVGRRLLDIRHGAITWHASNGLDYRNPRSNDARNVSSRGRISDAMVIRKDLVDHGVANNTDLGHVLHLFLCETRSRHGYCHPMTGAEDGKRGWGSQGERIAIAPHVNLARRGLSRQGLVIARTLQNYGCYIGDNSGSASALKAEQEQRGHRVWRGRLPQDVLRGITWDDFVVIKRGRVRHERE